MQLLSTLLRDSSGIFAIYMFGYTYLLFGGIMASRVFNDTFNGNLNISGGYGLIINASAVGAQ